MVGTGKPEGLFARHAAVADKNILQGMVQHMAKRQASGHIGRRHEHGIGLLARFEYAGAFGMETAKLLPVRTSPPLFDVVMIVNFFQIEYFGLIAHDNIVAG